MSRRDRGRSRDGADSWEARWRGRTEDVQDEHTEQLQDISLILERHLGRLDEHDRRLEALENRPAETRAWFGLANQSAGTVLAVVAIIVTLLFSFLNLLPHLAYHP